MIAAAANVGCKPRKVSGADMIVWRGWGILPVVIAGLTFLVMIGVDSGLKLRSDLLMASIAIAGGLANWFVGRWFNRPLEQAGVGYWKRHSLFFIQMEWWSLFFLFVAANLAGHGKIF
jgi:hypothetical protein